MQLWRHHVVQLGAPDEGVEARLVVNDNTYFKWVFINHNEVSVIGTTECILFAFSHQEIQ